MTTSNQGASPLEVPAFWEYMQAILEMLRERGAVSNRDFVEHVAPRMALSAEQLAVPHDAKTPGPSEAGYRMAWARTYLKKAGLIENTARGVWALTDKGRNTAQVDGRAIAREVSAAVRDTGAPETDAGEAYLLAWSATRFVWDDLDDQIRSIEESGFAEEEWSCGNARKIPAGSRVFLIRLGAEPRGIVGAGVTTDEVRQAPHWDAEVASQGGTANFVDVRFDFLSRVPLIRRAELDEPPFDGFKWDTQMSGVRIPETIAKKLEGEWRKRLEARARAESPAAIAEPVLRRWRERWENARSDSDWLERYRVRDEKRREFLPAMRELVTRFVNAEVSFTEYRETFDRKRSNEWDLFGFNRLSGAGFLTKLQRFLPDQDDMTAKLRAVLQVPASDAEARARLAEFMEYLADQIESGVTTAVKLRPNRVPFVVSVWWHAQDPERWPIMHPSWVGVLRDDGLLGRTVQGADGYQEFTRVFRALTDGLGISFWDLEHLCDRLQAAETISDDSSEDAEEIAGSQGNQRVWLISPGRGAEFFDRFYAEGIVAIGWDFLGDLSQYSDLAAVRRAIQEREGTDSNPVQNALSCFQFAHGMQVGDVVFAKRGRRTIVGYGVVTSAYRHEPERRQYTQVRSVDWKLRGEWVPREKPLVMKTLTEIGKYPGLVGDIRRALGIEATEEPEVAPETKIAPSYSLDDALSDLFVPREQVEEAVALLRYKKNLVLQGPPGVGKTFYAQRLAYLLLGEKDRDRVAQVQFHQSYSYEDFVQGYRPDGDGKFARVDGPFMRFCDQALQDLDSPYVLIIDEINRANLSKVFGELLLLIEADKRNETWATALTYSREGEPPFHVPKNLHVIGTMNTADRSLALVDYALRRRFAFIDLRPGFHEDGFKKKLTDLGAATALRDRIVRRVTQLNERLTEDPNLGPGFTIGHSYFCHTGGGPADDAWYERIVRTEIEPLLREYWFDHTDQASDEAAHLIEDD